jgi:16S rRNA (adenine1518-N6/adenine1519-N6)-dimethyltransferase
MQVKPKKALGQHFLTDLNIAHRIAATLDDYRGLPVVEVGPGMGVLTQFLLQAGHDVTAIEIDTESVRYLNRQFPDLRVLPDDFLRLDLAKLFPRRQFCVIGNYPYNISSQIFFHVLDHRDQITACSGMLQREVAERIAAQPGRKTRGILSVLLQAWYDIQYLFTVDEHVFNPPPKVKSGVIIMRRNQVTDLGCDENLFKTIVKTSFGQRRKTLRNSLRGLLPPAQPFPCPDMESLRPEQLSVEQFIQLTTAFSSLRDNQPAK